MKKHWGWAVLGLPLLAHAGSITQGTLDPGPRHLIIKFDRDAAHQLAVGSSAKPDPAIGPQQLADQALQELSLDALVQLRHERRLSTGAERFALNLLAPGDLTRVLSTLAALPAVEYALVDALSEAQFVPDDPRFAEQWSYFETVGGINLPSAWDLATGAGVRVAVIDTGHRPHADLRGNLLPGYDFISDPDNSRDGNGRDPDARDPGDGGLFLDYRWPSSWHGTHVAGTIAAQSDNGVGVAGVAFGARVQPLRVLGAYGGYDSDVVDALVWAAGGTVPQMPANPTPARVINLSLGRYGDCDPNWADALATVRSLGATVVVSAGNANYDAGAFAPSGCRGVISVAATTRDGHRAPYSNTGAAVDLAAPGGDVSNTIGDGILSTLNAGELTPGADSYAFYNGTSMAAPHVSGVAALMLQLRPSLGPDAIECTLKATARPIAGDCPHCGAGIVDAGAAVAAVRDGTFLEACPIDRAEPTRINPGEAFVVSGVRGDQLRYYLRVPAGQQATIETRGGIGEADLLANLRTEPSLGGAQCRSLNRGNHERCIIANLTGGDRVVRFVVHGFRDFRDVTVRAVRSLVTYLQRGVPISDLSGGRDSRRDFYVTVPKNATRLTVTLTGGTGDVDLHVQSITRDGTRGEWAYASLGPNNEETVSIDAPAPGYYVVSLLGYARYESVTLTARVER